MLPVIHGVSDGSQATFAPPVHSSRAWTDDLCRLTVININPVVCPSCHSYGVLRRHAAPKSCRETLGSRLIRTQLPQNVSFRCMNFVCAVLNTPVHKHDYDIMASCGKDPNILEAILWVFLRMNDYLTSDESIFLQDRWTVTYSLPWLWHVKTVYNFEAWFCASKSTAMISPSIVSCMVVHK